MALIAFNKSFSFSSVEIGGSGSSFARAPCRSPMPGGCPPRRSPTRYVAPLLPSVLKSSCNRRPEEWSRAAHATQQRSTDGEAPSSSTAPETPSTSAVRTSVLHTVDFVEHCSCKDIIKERHSNELLPCLPSGSELNPFLASCQIVTYLML